MEVEHTTRAAAANHLFAMNFVIMTGYMGLGFFGTALARRGIEARHLFGGSGLSAGAELGSRSQPMRVRGSGGPSSAFEDA